MTIPMKKRYAIQMVFIPLPNTQPKNYWWNTAPPLALTTEFFDLATFMVGQTKAQQNEMPFIF